MKNRTLFGTSIDTLMTVVVAFTTISLIATESGADDNPKQKSASVAQQPESDAASDHEQLVIGTVVCDNGKSVAGLNVVLTRQDGREVKVVQTDDRGRFATPMECWRDRYFSNEIVAAIVHDPQGRLGWFSIRASERDQRDADGMTRRVPAPEPMPFDLHLLPLNRVVTGQVLGPNREPLSKVRIQAVSLKSAVCGNVYFHTFDTRHELPLPSAMTDEAGRFRILLPDNVDIKLSVLHPDWIVKNIRVTNEDNLGEISLKPSAKLNGRLVHGETGIPASGILVFAHCFNALRAKELKQDRNKPDPDPDLGTDGACITDADGRYEIGGLREEPHYIQVDTKPLGREFLVPYGEVKVAMGTPKTVDLVVSRCRRIAGRVLDADSGEPVPDIEVHSHVTRPAEPGWSFGSGYEWTDEKGEFQFFALAGHCQVEAMLHPKYWRKVAESRVEFEIGDEDPPPVELRIQPAPRDVIEPRLLKALHFGLDQVSCFEFERDGKTVITGGARMDQEIADEQERWRAARGDLRLWDVASGLQVARFGDEPGRIIDLALSPDDSLIATAVRLPDDSGVIRVWNKKSQQVAMTLTGHKKAVMSVDISTDGRFLASGGWDKTARIWDLATGKEIFELKHNWSPHSLQFSPDGTLLATTGANAEIKFWHVATGAEAAMFEDKNNWVHGLAWSPTGNTLAINSSPAEGQFGSKEFIRLLSVTGKPNSVRVLERRAWSIEGFGSDIAFSADGNYIADARHVARAWRVPSGKEAVMIRQSSSSSGDRIRFSPDGKILAIGGHRAVVFWDITALHTTDVEK